MHTTPTSRGQAPRQPMARVGAAPALLVVVQRDWNGWRKAMTPMTALEDVHWHQPAGAPRPLIHAYVSCRDLVSGDVPHDCCGDHAFAHRLLVCVLRQHTAPSVFERLVARANAATSASISREF